MGVVWRKVNLEITDIVAEEWLMLIAPQVTTIRATTLHFLQTANLRDISTRQHTILHIIFISYRYHQYHILLVTSDKD